MRPLTSHVPHGALPTLATFMQHAQEARVFRRAHAVREVVTGQTVTAVSDTFHCTNSALRNGSSAVLAQAPAASWTAPVAADQPK
jgi:hypothetical protein